MSYNYSKRSLDNLKNIHPKFVELLKLAIIKSPYDFIITSGVRTTSEQRELYAQGRTKEGKIVTNADGIKKRSNHQVSLEDGYGHAIDIVIIDKTKKDGLDWDSTWKYEEVFKHMSLIADRMKIKIAWGGNWKKFKDYPHIEYVSSKK